MHTGGNQLLSWIKAKAQKKIVDTIKDEIERFVASLSGADAEEVADIILTATLLRLHLMETGQLDGDTLSIDTLRPTIEHDTQALHLNYAIKDFQKNGEYAYAVGAMVWWHTVRALQNPEIRGLGRSMWKELLRGQAVLEQNEQEYLRTHLDIQKAQFVECSFVPRGLEPKAG
jgi:hypothetical protein